MTLELQRVPDLAEVCADTTPATTADSASAVELKRSQKWHLELPLANIGVLQLSSVAAAEWESVIASKVLHFTVSRYVTLTHQVADESPRLHFAR